jgi:hypothetical protein
VFGWLSGNDDAIFNEFLAGFMPLPSESSFDETQCGFGMMPAHEQSLAPAAAVAAPSGPMMTMPTAAAPKTKRSAAVMLLSGTGPSSALLTLSNGNKSDKSRRIKKRRRRAFATDDCRRSFVDSLFGAINGGESLLPVLERIAHPDLVLTCRFLGEPASLSAGKLFREVKGRALISKFIDTMMLASPDSILRLHEKKMRLRQNNSSYIVAKYTLEGHQFCHVLTTNDKHMSKRALFPLKTIPAAANIAIAVAAAATTAVGTTACAKEGSGSGSECTSHDEDSQSHYFGVPSAFPSSSSSSSSSLSHCSLVAEEDEEEEDCCWGEQFIDVDEEMSTAGSPLDLTDDCCFADDFHHHHLTTEAETESEPAQLCAEQTKVKSLHLLNAWQFAQRPSTISGAEEKVSVSSNTTEFGVGSSLASPTLISTIGTMALHINPNRQVYKIDFLWTYSKPKASDETKVTNKP